jgi:hypothetical protein
MRLPDGEQIVTELACRVSKRSVSLEKCEVSSVSTRGRSRFTVALLHCCIVALTHCCIIELTHCCIIALMHCCIIALLHYCIIALMHCCTVALLHCCIIALMHCCTVALVSQKLTTFQRRLLSPSDQRLLNCSREISWGNARNLTSVVSPPPSKNSLVQASSDLIRPGPLSWPPFCARFTHHPDDGGSKYFRNVGIFLQGYKAQHPRRRPYCSNTTIVLLGK